MKANILMSIRKTKAQKGLKRKSSRGLEVWSKEQENQIGKQNTKTCTNGRTRGCSGVKAWD